eukprot:scaffold2716_cov179-Amphora_coffeaeformis.AAC.4
MGRASSMTTTRGALTMVLAFLVKVCSGVTLTPMNYESSTAGKTVFINFYDPSCGYCKKMQPTWDKLTADYAGHEKFLVASVDCSTEMGKIWCRETFEVDGTPELWYGSPEYHGALLEFYDGGRSYEELAEFAKQVLAKPLCSEENFDACSEENKAILETLLKKDETDSQSNPETDLDEDMHIPGRDDAYGVSDEL